jgi:RNA polymerase sigma-70 factor, ECF subfamily
MSKTCMTEEELIDRCLQLNEKAQEELYNLYSSKMMGVTLRYVKTFEEAQDVLQDGFIKVFDKLDTYTREGSFEGWIRRIIVNTALDYLRKVKHEKFHVDVDEVNYFLADQTIILESMAAEDLLQIIQSLPVGYQTVFNLYAIEGYTHKEIGEQLGVSENTSKSQYSRAKLFLQKKLEEINTI